MSFQGKKNPPTTVTSMREILKKTAEAMPMPVDRYVHGLWKHALNNGNKECLQEAVIMSQARVDPIPMVGELCLFITEDWPRCFCIYTTNSLSVYWK